MIKMNFADWLSDTSDDIQTALDDIESEIYGFEDAKLSREDANTLNDFVEKAIGWLEQARNYVQNITEEEDEEDEE